MKDKEKLNNPLNECQLLTVHILNGFSHSAVGWRKYLSVCETVCWVSDNSSIMTQLFINVNYSIWNLSWALCLGFPWTGAMLHKHLIVHSLRRYFGIYSLRAILSSKVSCSSNNVAIDLHQNKLVVEMILQDFNFCLSLLVM